MKNKQRKYCEDKKVILKRLQDRTGFACIFPQKNPNMKEEKKIQKTTAPVMPRPRIPIPTSKIVEIRAQIKFKMGNLNHDKLKLVVWPMEILKDIQDER